MIKHELTEDSFGWLSVLLRVCWSNAIFVCALLHQLHPRSLLRMKGRLSYHSLFQLLWLVFLCHLTNLLRISNLITKVQQMFLSLTNIFHSSFINAKCRPCYLLSGKHHNKQTWDVGRKWENLVNHAPLHPVWFIAPINPLKEWCVASEGSIG